MNEEETKETLKTMKENIDKKYLKTRNSVAIETVLNLLEKKDKMIDEMAEYLASIDFDEHCVEVPGICMGCPKEDDLDGYMQCIKQYFERKVDNGN